MDRRTFLKVLGIGLAMPSIPTEAGQSPVKIYSGPRGRVGEIRDNGYARQPVEGASQDWGTFRYYIGMHDLPAEHPINQAKAGPFFSGE
jgi:hypothetical protein